MKKHRKRKPDAKSKKSNRLSKNISKLCSCVGGANHISSSSESEENEAENRNAHSCGQQQQFLQPYMQPWLPDSAAKEDNAITCERLSRATCQDHYQTRFLNSRDKLQDGLKPRVVTFFFGNDTQSSSDEEDLQSTNGEGNTCEIQAVIHTNEYCPLHGTVSNKNEIDLPSNEEINKEDLTEFPALNLPGCREAVNTYYRITGEASEEQATVQLTNPTAFLEASTPTAVRDLNNDVEDENGTERAVDAQPSCGTTQTDDDIDTTGPLKQHSESESLDAFSWDEEDLHQPCQLQIKFTQDRAVSDIITNGQRMVDEVKALIAELLDACTQRTGRVVVPLTGHGDFQDTDTQASVLTYQAGTEAASAEHEVPNFLGDLAREQHPEEEEEIQQELSHGEMSAEKLVLIEQNAKYEVERADSANKPDEDGESSRKVNLQELTRSADDISSEIIINGSSISAIDDQSKATELDTSSNGIILVTDTRDESSNDDWLIDQIRAAPSPPQYVPFPCVSLPASEFDNGPISDTPASESESDCSEYLTNSPVLKIIGLDEWDEPDSHQCPISKIVGLAPADPDCLLEQVVGGMNEEGDSSQVQMLPKQPICISDDREEQTPSHNLGHWEHGCSSQAGSTVGEEPLNNIPDNLSESERMCEIITNDNTHTQDVELNSESDEDAFTPENYLHSENVDSMFHQTLNDFDDEEKSEPTKNSCKNSSPSPTNNVFIEPSDLILNEADDLEETQEGFLIIPFSWAEQLPVPQEEFADEELSPDYEIDDIIVNVATVSAMGDVSMETAQLGRISPLLPEEIPPPKGHSGKRAAMNRNNYTQMELLDKLFDMCEETLTNNSMPKSGISKHDIDKKNPTKVTVDETSDLITRVEENESSALSGSESENAIANLVTEGIFYFEENIRADNIEDLSDETSMEHYKEIPANKVKQEKFETSETILKFPIRNSKIRDLFSGDEIMCLLSLFIVIAYVCVNHGPALMQMIIRWAWLCRMIIELLTY